MIKEAMSLFLIKTGENIFGSPRSNRKLVDRNYVGDILKLIGTLSSNDERPRRACDLSPS
jgi:hypothetical protein